MLASNCREHSTDYVWGEVREKAVDEAYLEEGSRHWAGDGSGGFNPAKEIGFCLCNRHCLHLKIGMYSVVLEGGSCRGAVRDFREVLGPEMLRLS